MYPEVPYDALIKMDREVRANALNSRYLDVLRARMFLTTKGFDGTFPEDIRIYLNQIGQLADEAIKKDNADNKGIVLPLIDNHKGETYNKLIKYKQGNILVWGANNLLFFEVISYVGRDYFCRRGKIVVDNKFDYTPILTDKPSVRVGKGVFTGIVFLNIEVLKENVTSQEYSSKRRKLKKMLEIIDKQLSDVWSKHLPNR